MLPLLIEATFTFCHEGRGMSTLTPPPVDPAPLPLRRPGDTHQTCSLLAVVPVNIVPPTLNANGLTLGKSTCPLPSFNSSPEPSSPEATQTVIPSSAAAESR